eukprot:GCRY01004182.1.p1 GENE.GCRY01004182.1~~GCRY01004182.1.p1  ORF type:complete len:495 (+),score=82.51 GCRY01004182.1:94-1578(+)
MIVAKGTKFWNGARKVLRPFSALIGQPRFATHPHLMKVNELLPGVPIKEFESRRKNVLSAMESNSLFVVPSRPQFYQSHDIPFKYRQQNEFLYLSGLEEEHGVVLLEKSSGGDTQYTLGVRPRSPEMETWDGPRVGPDNAILLFGANQAFTINPELKEIQEQLHSRLSTGATDRVYYLPAIDPQFDRIIQQLHKDFPSVLFTPDVREIVDPLRLHKSATERQLLQQAAHISATAFNHTIAATPALCAAEPRLGGAEHQIAAHLDYQFRRLGAKRNAFPSVVAGGYRAATVHYLNADMHIWPGDMVLVDSGAEYNNYASDITRTWPVDGKFTLVQRDVYNAVLHVQESCLRFLHERVGTASLLDLHMHSVGEMVYVLRHLKVLPENDPGRYSRYYVHSIGHFVGLDVHDTESLGPEVRLQPGMCLTVEPGLYFRKDDLSLPPQFRGCGVRIEDTVLIQPPAVSPSHSGPRGDMPIVEVITSDAVKTIEDIERIMS